MSMEKKECFRRKRNVSGKGGSAETTVCQDEEVVRDKKDTSRRGGYSGLEGICRNEGDVSG